MKNNFTATAQNALNFALAAARGFGHTYIGSEHILLGLANEKNSVAARVLESRGITADKIKQQIVEICGAGEKISTITVEMTPRTKRIIEYSAEEARSLGHNYIGTEHLLMALLKEKDCVAERILVAEGVNVGLLYNDILMFFNSNEYIVSQGQGKGGEGGAAKGNSQTPTLNQFGKDLTDAARSGKLDPIIGRDEEMQRVIQILSRRTKNNPCLIGEPGVGKTAVVEGLAQKIVDGNVPETLKDKRVVTLDLSSMIAGAKYRGEFEERMKNVMEEIRKNPNIIIFIDEIHTIVGAGAAEGAVDAANILKPALSRGEMQVIGATTINEYRKHIEKDSALERRFQSVLVGEPSEEETIQIMRGLRDKYEAHHKIKITDAAINAAVTLSARYINDRFLPDKAIDLIDEAASKKRIGSLEAPPELKQIESEIKIAATEKEAAVRAQDFEKAARERDKEKKLTEKLDALKKNWTDNRAVTNLSIGETDIADIVASWTGIPVRELESEEAQKLLKLDETLHQQVIGQDEAVSAVARAIRRSRVGLKDPKRPSGSFIFLGPTGVGKTELAKALARALFSSENSMIRIDMSEYMEKHSVSKLIGSPPGYVGYDEAGQLTEKVRRHPYSIVLFDEIEKAHPDVFNILLQILEDGILTDSQGRKVSFKNCVIIMTSNVGAGAIVEPKRMGFGSGGENAEAERQNADIMTALRGTFRPEFLNRVDEIIIFHKLTADDLTKITLNMLKEVRARIADLGVQIEFAPETVEYISKKGFDPIYGARPLRRAVQQMVEDSFSTAMLEGTIKAGDKVTAHIENEKIVYRK